MTPVSNGTAVKRPLTTRALRGLVPLWPVRGRPRTTSVLEAWIFLTRLLPSRAWCRFSRFGQSTPRALWKATTFGHRSYASKTQTNIATSASRDGFPDEPLWFHKSGHRDLRFPDRPWYRKKCEPSFADMLSTLRRLSWQEKIRGALPKHTLSKKVIRQVIFFLSHRASPPQLRKTKTQLLRPELGCLSKYHRDAMAIYAKLELSSSFALFRR